MNYNGINRLGRVLQRRMGQVAEAPATIDIATVTANGGIIADGDELTIPKEDVARIENCEGVGDSNVRITKLMAGDRVVIAYVGDDIVILGRLV